MAKSLGNDDSDNPTPPFDVPTCCAGSRTRSFDVLVIGGGITGVGVALDAASAWPAHGARRA